MDFKKIDDFKNKFNNADIECGEKIESLNSELEVKSLLSIKSKLKRILTFTGVFYFIFLFGFKGIANINPSLFSFLIPILVSGAGCGINKIYEKIFLKYDYDELKITKRLLEEEVEKEIERNYLESKQVIYNICANNLETDIDVYKDLDSNGINIEKDDNRSIQEVKENIFRLKQILIKKNVLLKRLCTKKVLMVYFNEYKNTKFVELKNFFKTNILALGTCALTTAPYIVFKIPVNLLGVTISSCLVGTIYSNFLNKSNNDNISVFKEKSKKYDLSELNCYKNVNDIESEIDSLVLELSRINEIISKEQIALEEKEEEKTNFLDNSFNYYKTRDIKPFVRTRTDKTKR